MPGFPAQQDLNPSLPAQVDILCTHPMFGPDSGKGSWAGLNMMYEVVRLGEASSRHHRLQTFLKVSHLHVRRRCCFRQSRVACPGVFRAN